MGERGNPAGLRQAPQKRRRTWERGRAAPGARVVAPMRLPTIYRGGGGWFLALQVHWGVGKGGRKDIPSFPFPTDCYPSFLGILILSLRDMILFLLRGDLGAP